MYNLPGIASFTQSLHKVLRDFGHRWPFDSRRFSARRRRGQFVADVEVCELRLVLSASIWTQSGADAGHSGYIDVSPVPSAIALGWSKQTGPSLPAVAIDQDFVYRTAIIGGNFGAPHEVQAYRLSDGTLAWKQTVTTYSHTRASVPSVFNGQVFVNTPGHSASSPDHLPRLYAFDAVTGTIVADRSYASQFGSGERPTIKDNLLVAEDGYYGGMSGFTATTLVPRWHVGGHQNELPDAAIAGDVIIAWENALYDHETGALITTQLDQQGGRLFNAVVSESGRVLFEGTGNQNAPLTSFVTSVDLKTKSVLWTKKFDAVKAKAVGNGIVAVASNSKITLLSETNGDVLRSWTAPDPLTKEIAITKTHVFVQSYKGDYTGIATVHAINLTTGLEDWKFSNKKSDGYLQMSIAIGGGRLVVSTPTLMHVFQLGDLTPVVVDEYVEAVEDTPIVIDVLKNDRALGGALLQRIVSATANHGVVNIVGGKLRYRPEANYSGPDQLAYTVRDSAGRLASGVVTLTIAEQTDPPIPKILAPASAVEGRLVRFDGTGSVNPDVGAMTYTWEFSDGVVKTGAVVDHAFPDGGTYTVKLKVNNGVAASKTRSILVSNTAPVLTVGSIDTVLRNSTVPLRLSVKDALADSGNTLQYTIDWSDGSPVQTVTGTSAPDVSHVFLRTGTFFVKSQVKDKDGVMSRIVSTRVIVRAVELKNQILTIEGTEFKDTIVIRPGAVENSVIAVINGKTMPDFVGVTLIIVNSRAGDDSLTLQNANGKSISIPFMVDAGTGNDTVTLGLSLASNVLLGGDGNDNITGGGGRDILIGGSGRDVLRGGGNDDLLTGGIVQLDFTPSGMGLMMTEWARLDADYFTRIGHLIDLLPDGLNGSVILQPTNVLDDQQTDSLFGELGRDLFFGNNTGLHPDVFDKKSDELLLSLPNNA